MKVTNWFCATKLMLSGLGVMDYFFVKSVDYTLFVQCHMVGRIWVKNYKLYWRRQSWPFSVVTRFQRDLGKSRRNSVTIVKLRAGNWDFRAQAAELDLSPLTYVRFDRQVTWNWMWILQVATCLTLRQFMGCYPSHPNTEQPYTLSGLPSSHVSKGPA